MDIILQSIGAELLVVLVLLALPAWALWGWFRQVRRAKDKANYGLHAQPDHCLGCNYDLAGLARAGQCPECGRPYSIGSRRSR